MDRTEFVGRRAAWRSRRAVGISALACATTVFSIGTTAAATTANRHSGRSGRAVTVVSSRYNPSYFQRIVVDSRGYTLYVWVRDIQNSHGSAHADKNFPRLIAHGKVVAARGSRLNVHKLSETKLSNGEHQVTYYGQPLYLYKGDHRPGQANGEYVQQDNGTWGVVNTSGRPTNRQY